MSRRKAALVTFAGTGGTVAITVAQAFLLIPLCLRYLGTPTYGAWIAATEILIWIQLLDLGVPNLMTQRAGAAAGRSDLELAASWSRTGLTLLAVIGAALALAGAVVAPLVTTWTGVPVADAGTFTACFRLGALASAGLLLFNGAIGLSRGMQRTVEVNVAQVSGAVVGLVLSIGLLVQGWGLWALAWGLLGRSVVSVFGGLVFMFRLPVITGGWFGAASRPLVAEIVDLAPSMAGASAGYLLANNTEILLVTSMFGPVAAAVYALTRRAIDGLRSLLDAVAWAVYGGFAHLAAADDKDRARGVLDEILDGRLALASLCAAVVVAVNPAFVRLLFGAENFGGVWLTAALAAQMVIGGQSFLANFLYRAAGHVRTGSLMLAAEAVLRVAAAALGLWVAGLPGGPTAAVVVNLAALIATIRLLDRQWPSIPVSAPPAGRFWAPVAVFAGSILVSLVWRPTTWGHVGLTAAAVGAASAVALWLGWPEGTWRGLRLRWTR